jgi:hypothetical protein
MSREVGVRGEDRPLGFHGSGPRGLYRVASVTGGTRYSQRSAECYRAPLCDGASGERARLRRKRKHEPRRQSTEPAHRGPVTLSPLDYQFGEPTC